jgi:hypothetical protein
VKLTEDEESDWHTMHPLGMQTESYTTYRIFSNLIRTLFTVLKGQKVRYVLDSLSRAGFWKNDIATVHAVRTIQYNTIQYNNLLFYLLL